MSPEMVSGSERIVIMGKKNESKKSQSVAVNVSKAQGFVASAESVLGASTTLSAKERKARVGLLKLGPAVTRLIAQALAQFNSASAQSILDGLEYETAMSPVAQATRSLATKIEDTLLDRRAATAKSAYAAYQ